MFSASGNAVIAGEAQGNANAGSPKPAPADGSAAE
jgi:hypothetical protein